MTGDREVQDHRGIQSTRVHGPRGASVGGKIRGYTCFLPNNVYFVTHQRDVGRREEPLCAWTIGYVVRLSRCTAVQQFAGVVKSIRVRAAWVAPYLRL